MSVLLNASQALDPGVTLWILPFDPDSPWYQRLNWLTHFSLTTNELHTRPKLHPWLVKILETCDIPEPTIPLSEPLLVPVAQWLPAEWLVVVPFNNHHQILFLQSVLKIWKQLQEPSLRLFLPLPLSLKEWENHCVGQGLPDTISLVMEPTDEELTLQ